MLVALGENPFFGMTANPVDSFLPSMDSYYTLLELPEPLVRETQNLNKTENHWAGAGVRGRKRL